MIDDLKKKIDEAALSPLQKTILNKYVDEELVECDLQKKINALVNEKVEIASIKIEQLIEDYKDIRSAVDTGVYAGLVMAEEIVKEVIKEVRK